MSVKSKQMDLLVMLRPPKNALVVGKLFYLFDFCMSHSQNLQHMIVLESVYFDLRDYFLYSV